MSNRRECGGELVGIAARGIAGNFVVPEQKTSANNFMHVGGDYHSVVGGNITSKENLECNLRHGVKHLTAEVSKNPQGAWDPDELRG